MMTAPVCGQDSINARPEAIPTHALDDPAPAAESTGPARPDVSVTA